MTGTELRNAARALVRQPKFTLLVTALLGFGVGLSVALLCLVNAVFSSPFPETHQLVWVADHSGPGDLLVTPAQFESLQQGPAVFKDVAAYTQFKAADYLTLSGSLYPINSCSVTSRFFATLEVSPARGRVFSPNDHDPVVVVSWRLWANVFHKRPDLVGQVIQVNGFPFSVIGIMGPQFGFPGDADIWFSLEQSGDLRQPYLRDDRRLHVIARQKSELTQSEVAAGLQVASAKVTSQNATVYRESELRTSPFTNGLLGRLTEMLNTARTLAIAVFLLALANVGVLLLLRNQRRHQEAAIRLTLGATESSILRVAGFEAFLLSLIGGCIAFGVGEYITILIQREWVGVIPSYAQVRLPLVLGIAALLTALSALFVTIFPQFLVLRSELAPFLTTGQRSTGTPTLRRALYLLLAIEIGTTTALLFVAALSLHRFESLKNMSLGIQTDNLEQTELYIPGIAYKKQSDKAHLIEQALNQLSGIRNARSVAVGIKPALEEFAGESIVRPAEKSLIEVHVDVKPISYQYFSTLGIPILSGRDFNTGEMENGGAVILDASAASLLWRDKFSGDRTIFAGRETERVVGIVADTTYFGTPTPTLYVPIIDSIAPHQSFLLLHVFAKGSDSDLRSLQQSAQESVQNIPGAAFGTFAPVSEEFGLALVTPRLESLTALLMGLVSIVIAAGGLYAITAYWISMRRREIAIRVALGATAPRIIGSIFQWLFTVTLLATVVGFAIVVLVESSLSPKTGGVVFYDPLSVLVVSCTIIAIVLLATCVPSWLAAKATPYSFLRDE